MSDAWYDFTRDNSPVTGNKWLMVAESDLKEFEAYMQRRQKEFAQTSMSGVRHWMTQEMLSVIWRQRMIVDIPVRIIYITCDEQDVAFVNGDLSIDVESVIGDLVRQFEGRDTLTLDEVLAALNEDICDE